MTPAQAALCRRCGSGATNPPAPAPKPPRIVAVPGPPLKLESPPGTPEAILARFPAQLRVFQWLDDRAASGEERMPPLNIAADQLKMSEHQIGAAIGRLTRNGLLKVTRAGPRIAAIQIVVSGRWLRK